MAMYSGRAKPICLLLILLKRNENKKMTHCRLNTLSFCFTDKSIRSNFTTHNLLNSYYVQNEQKQFVVSVHSQVILLLMHK